LRYELHINHKNIVVAS